jgi:site-specific DNA-methyltransferase (adenine-specific)
MERTAPSTQRPYFQDESVTLYHGDCIEQMRHLPDNSVDSVVTDPPYGLEFMGREWDGADGFRRSLNAADVGRENVFGRASAKAPEYKTTSRARAGMAGTGYTDGANRIERPSFLGGINPKCLACGKWQRGGNPCSCEAPDFPNERAGRMHTFQEWCEAWASEALRILKPGGHMLAFGGTRTWHRLAAAVEDAGFEIRDSIAWLYGSGMPKVGLIEGWGATLKPAFEPVVVGRKPLVGTVAANMLLHGVGALNIDASRVGSGEGSQGARDSAEESATKRYTESGSVNFSTTPGPRGGSPAGRFPSNVMLDESQAAVLDQQAPKTGGSGPASGPTRTGGSKSSSMAGAFNGTEDAAKFYGGELGGASRFFYVAKAPKVERPIVDGVAHPTVKPITLMRYLVNLVTPPGGTVLEPFAGSGTTVEACILDGFKVIAIERGDEYLPLIEKRIERGHAAVRAEAVRQASNLTLFDEAF